MCQYSVKHRNVKVPVKAKSQQSIPEKFCDMSDRIPKYFLVSKASNSFNSKLQLTYICNLFIPPAPAANDIDIPQASRFPSLVISHVGSLSLSYAAMLMRPNKTEIAVHARRRGRGGGRGGGEKGGEERGREGRWYPLV